MTTINKTETPHEYNIEGDDGRLKAVITAGFNAISVSNLEKTKTVLIYLDDMSVETGMDEIELMESDFKGGK